MNASPSPLVMPVAEPSTISRDGPLVSVIIASRNNANFLPECLDSVARQTLSDYEVIVVDDASDDYSRDVVAKRCEADSRITLLCNLTQCGPAQARNRALDACRGRWIAVLDSDDLMHRERLAILVQAAEESGADILADNQILFYEASGKKARPLLNQHWIRKQTIVSCDFYVESNRLRKKGAPLGYLKPIFRRSFIEKGNIRYNPCMSIAEDYDFVLRLLLAGASFRIVPSLTYFYRRHRTSTSFRLSRENIVQMLDGDTISRRNHAHQVAEDVEHALQRRRRSIEDALSYTDLVSKLKAGDWAAAFMHGARAPRSTLFLADPVKERVGRLFSRRRSQTQTSRRACVLSRQRVTGATNGSSAYLLGICAALRDDGWIVDLVSPSPAMFGRWPVLRLLPEMSVFRSVRMRGALKLGSTVFAINPMIALRALLAVIDKALRRLHLGLGVFAQKAPHAIAVPLTDADRLFVASHARQASFIVADYEFLTEAVAFALSPSARTAVVMHDLFSAQNTANRPVTVDRGREMELLGAVDVVLAIQKEEAEIVASHLGADRVIIVPMAIDHVAAAQEGDGHTVLFVGSNTLPNVDAAQWLITTIWPFVVAVLPEARLCIAGTVCQAITTRRNDVQLLGRLNSLVEVYRHAAVVVSPLRSGSGLKVKLVEAMAHGKAIIGTSVTFQGVEHLAGAAASCLDEAKVFADEIIFLLRSPDVRRERGERALAAAAREFSPNRSYKQFLQYAAGAADRASPLAVPSGAKQSGNFLAETI